MLAYEDIESQIDRSLIDVSKIRDGVIRCTRRHENQDISYYYIDYSQKIHEAAQDLKNYQETLLAEDFFSKPSEIQWSYYLLFVVDQSEYENLKKDSVVKKIETNKEYTRKFVLPQNEVKDFLDFTAFSSEANNGPIADLTSRWVEALDNTGLSGIYGKGSRKDVIESFIAGPAEVISLPQQLSTEIVANGKQITEIALKSYRPYPLRREFNFGLMNLFVGPNGVGKTSLLEAIEMAYCGSTLRSGGEPEDNTVLHFKFKNSLVVEQYDPKDNKKYQQRDLAWYGKPVVRGNDLFSSFNKYNFYNADSAYRMAHDSKSEDINLAFASLALGEKANYIDKRIRDFSGDFADRYKQSKKVLDSLNITLGSEKEAFRQMSVVEKTSDKLYEVLKNSFSNLHFSKVLPKIEDLMNSDFSSEVIELRNDLSHFSKNYSWITQLSYKFIFEKWNEYQLLDHALVTNDTGSAESRNNLLKIANEYRKTQDICLGLRRLELYFENERFKKIAGISEKLKIAQTRLNKVFRARDAALEASFELMSSFDPDKDIRDLIRDLKKDKLELQKEILERESLVGRERERIGYSKKLVSDIRSLALNYIQITPSVQDCPICTAHYPQGRLHEILAMAVSVSDDSSLVEMSSHLERDKKKLSSLDSIVNHLERVYVVLTTLNDVLTAERYTIRSLLLSRKELDNEVVELERNIKLINDSILELSDLGLNEAEFGLLLDLCGVSITSTFLDVNELLKTNLARLDEHFNSEGLVKKAIEDLAYERKRLLSPMIDNGNEDLPELEDKFRERFKEVVFLLNQLTVIRQKLAVEDSVDVSTMFRHVEVAVEQLKSFLDTYSLESKKSMDFDNAKKRIEKIEAQVEAEGEIFKRLDYGCKTLTNLLANDSKEKALEGFIEQNRDRINKIFKTIHSPHEFEGLIPGTTKLKRIGVSGETPLNMVSTGQRSALAIAIFLSLNLSLKNAPPIILIDDPVAHVDDLNTLSFLDFLREVVIRGDRQIFFATASQKLASLIEKKFSFLESDFKKYDFER